MVGKAQEAVLGKQAGLEAAKASRHLDRRDTEEAADRWIAEQLPGVPMVRFTEHVIDGRSARQKVVDDKREARKRKGKLTQPYSLALRRKYKLGFAWEFTIEDPNQVIQEVPMTALRYLTPKHSASPCMIGSAMLPLATSVNYASSAA